VKSSSNDGAEEEREKTFSGRNLGQWRPKREEGNCLKGQRCLPARVRPQKGAFVVAKEDGTKEGDQRLQVKNEKT